ncbi:MAG: FtsQ-type POTRA domain-containing protein [Gemmatimonadota bacterium]|nr:FtsQ-type POTRA domain-containing protein [Gemmatimonadota bacterium]
MSGRPPESAPVPSKRRKRAWLLSGAAVLFVAIFASPWWGPRVLRRLDFFRVRKIEVVGARYTPVDEVLERLQLDTTRSIWDSLQPLVKRVETHPQVEHANVQRRFPGTLVVTLTERRPVALTPTPDGLRALDEHGRTLPLDPTRTPVDAPIVITARRDTTVYHLLGVIQREAPRLFARVSSISTVGADEMVLHIAGLPIRAMTSVSLARLSDVELVERDLARRQIHATELDLRYRDQVIARLP